MDGRATITNVHIDHYSRRMEQLNATEISKGRLQDIRSAHPDMDRSCRERTQTRHIWTGSIMERFLFNIRTVSHVKRHTSFNVNSLTLHQYQDQDECETTYSISPAAWMIRLGVCHGLRLNCLLSSIQGWKSTLEILRPVPDDALIFEYCRKGDESAVRELLSRGHASVRDIDSRGFTPLHVSLLRSP